MADPVTVIQVISASTSLVAQCAKVIKGLHDLAGKDKNAEVSIRSTAHELDIIRLAWERIESVLMAWEGDEGSDDELLERLRQNLEFGALIVAALAEDMSTFTKRPFTFTQRSKYVWSEKKFKDHQDRIRGQVSAMNLLVSVLKMPTAVERLSCLHEGAEVLRKSDESAYTIVPSHMSSRLPSIYSNSSRISIESAKLVYRQLTIDNDLFTARVYKRNYRHPSMNFPMKTRTSTSLQIHERPSTEVVATETLNHQVRPVSLGSQSVISLDEEESISQPPHSTRATLLKTLDIRLRPGDRVISSSLWVSGLPTSPTGRNTIVGPAVSIDLVYVYMDRDPEQSRNLAESVSQCQPEQLAHLLRLLAGGFPTWRKRYLGEACNQEKVGLVQLLLANDQGLWKKLVPRERWSLHDDTLHSSRHLNDVASKLLDTELELTELGKQALANAVARAQLDIVFKELRRRKANRFLSYGFPMEHSLLLAAADERDWNTVDALVKHGVDVNAKFEDGKTCLLKMASLSDGKPDSMEIDWSPAVFVIEAFESLLALGADLEATTHNGDNFLHLAAQNESPWPAAAWHDLQIDKAKLFSALSALNREGKTPVLVAEQVGNEQFLAFVDDLNQMEVLRLDSGDSSKITKL